MKLILEEETFKKFGYHSRDLKKYSNKKIITKCGECGKVREVRKKDYRDLCYSCSIKRKERGQKIGKAHIGNHHSDKSKQKMHEVKIGKYSGEKNPAWKGGISFEPYCILFTKEFKERVREYWDRKCVLCDKTELENGRKLNVHHVTYNKESCCDDSIPYS